MRFYKGFVKRIFDFLTVMIFLPFWSAVVLLIALILKIKEPLNPVFFCQRRVGREGKYFWMIKFRTMVPNVDANTITTAEDKRITGLGKFLRKWKLDELPELFNVLKGEMSLVGPRPDVVGYADQLTGEDRLILELRPGITGPASIKYANEEELLAKVDDPKEYNDRIIFPDKVRINLNYYYKNNVLMDLKIIINTIFRKNSVS